MRIVNSLLCVVTASTLAAAASALAGGTDGGRGGLGRGAASYSGRTVPDVARDQRGRIARSQKAKNDFKRLHPCPATGKSRGACPGYVIDHVVPLKRGGADRPDNMQWQTREAAKEKDRTE